MILTKTLVRKEFSPKRWHAVAPSPNAGHALRPEAYSAPAENGRSKAALFGFGGDLPLIVCCCRRCRAAHLLARSGAHRSGLVSAAQPSRRGACPPLYGCALMILQRHGRPRHLHVRLRSCPFEHEDDGDHPVIHIYGTVYGRRRRFRHAAAHRRYGRRTMYFGRRLAGSRRRRLVGRNGAP